MKAVILAGGKGARLAPYTTVFPKPLMPVGGKPILEVIIRQLAANGFTQVILAVGYLSELIRAYCGNGAAFGIPVTYVQEDTPLGTAGPLSRVDGLSETFLVMNGDILSLLSYKRFIESHVKSGAIATIAVNKRQQKADYGVIRLQGQRITEYIEKPMTDYYVSMGMYLFEPAVQASIPHDAYFDFPALVQKLLGAGQQVNAYVSDDYWLDIGRHDDYARAQAEFESIKERIYHAR